MHPDPRSVVHSLPARPVLHLGQALDCYLEHLADANHLSAGTLMSTVTAATDTTRYLLLRPTPTTVEVLSRLTGQTGGALTAATLAPLDGTLLDLSGLDPHDQYSYRAVAARGWPPGQGTQICPACLAETGTWDIAWRLPTTTVCLRHRTYLLATCPGCDQPFRATRHTLLRPIGAATTCGNPLGRRGRFCKTDLTALPAQAADPGCIDRAAATTAERLAVAPPRVLGARTTPRQLLEDVQSLTTLLLHIATATSRASLLPRWGAHVHPQTQDQRRAPRWGLRPPRDIPTRSRALTTATEILTAADLETAVARLAPWIDAIPPAPEGRLGWAGDHTRHTGATTRLIMSTHARRRRLAGLLSVTPPLAGSTRQIPQLLPRRLYEAHLAGLFTSRPQTIQLFACLTMARTRPGITTWADAAHALGLPPETGTRCAAAAAASQTASPPAVLAAVHAAARELDGRDYRALEARIRIRANDSSWFTTWRRDHRPGTRAASQPLAVQWLWAHAAHAHPMAAPGTTPARARRFAATLTPAQEDSLRCLLDDLTCAHPGLVERVDPPDASAPGTHRGSQREEDSPSCA